MTESIGLKTMEAREDDNLIQPIGRTNEEDGVTADDNVKFGLRKTYSRYSAYAVCVNYVIGSGVFTLPYAFFYAGGILSFLCLFAGTVSGMICMSFVVEQMARVEGVVAVEEAGGTGPPLHRIGYRKFDFSEISRVFIGRWGGIFTRGNIILYCYGVLWLFTAVFGQSLSTIINHFAFGHSCEQASLSSNDKDWCDDWNMASYRGSVAVYCLVVIPLSVLDIGEQIYVQVMLTLYRFSAFIFMVVTASIKIALSNSAENKLISHFWDVKFDGFGAVFLATAVAFNCHYNMPDALQPVRNKSYLRAVTWSALSTASIVYSILGVVVAIAFTDKINALATLNWNDYTACGDGWELGCTGRAGFAEFVQIWIMMFPALDMISVFPLVTVTLANNILLVYPQSIHDRYSEKRIKLFTRLLSSIPPLIMGISAGDIAIIFKIAGLFAFFLELIIPTIVQLYSVSYCVKRWGEGSQHTMYSTWVSRTGKTVAIICLIYGVAAFIGGCVSTAMSEE